jgi:peptidoglycan/xylan/chitin deacetylase (PgdA/CDA1 family)
MNSRSNHFSFLMGFSALGLAFVAACSDQNQSKTPENSQVQDFTSSQLMGRNYDSLGNTMPAKTLALTFDDGLGSRSVELAQYLKNEGIQAAFFVNGVNGRTADMAAIQKMNHLLANHTHNHQDMVSSNTNAKSQVVLTDNVIKPYVTGDIYMFRAPFGSWSGNVASYLNGQGLRKYVGSIFWDVGGQLTNSYSADWDCWGQGLSVSNCGQGYLNEIADKGRGIVLMHDIHSKTVDMVKYIVPILKQRGYKFMRVDLVPTVAEQIRKSGGKPGTQYAPSKPKVLGPIECPVGYTLTSVGTEGGRLCTDGTNAWGPFTQGMVAECKRFGGGPACDGLRWSQNMAINLRGTGVCPVGASFDEETTYCVEGVNAFGPFPKSLVEKCVEKGGGEATCQSARWNRNFLAALLK